MSAPPSAGPVQPTEPSLPRPWSWAAGWSGRAGLPVPEPYALGIGAAGALAVLALTSTGSVVVAAMLLGLVARDRRSAVASLAAAASVGVRFATGSLDRLAGLQSVLGPAGLIEPATGAAASWCAAVALVLAVRPVRTPEQVRTAPIAIASVVLPALAAGALAAAFVAGPGTGDLPLRAGATLVGVLVAGVALRTEASPRLTAARLALAVVAGVAAVALAAVPEPAVEVAAVLAAAWPAT